MRLRLIIDFDIQLYMPKEYIQKLYSIAYSEAHNFLVRVLNPLLSCQA